MTAPTNVNATSPIRMQRVARGMSLREAAAKLSMTPGALAEVERGVRDFTPGERAEWDRACLCLPPTVEVRPLDLPQVTQTAAEVRAEFGCTCPPGGPRCMTCVMEVRGTYNPPPLECTCGPDGPEAAECLLCGMRECPRMEPLHYHHDGCPACTDGFRGGPAHEVTPGPFPRDAEPVALHPRVGTTVVDEADARTLPPDTLVECDSVHVDMRLWRKLRMQWRCCGWPRLRSSYGRIIGARILYVPTGEP